MLKNRIYYLIFFIVSFWLMMMYEGVYAEAMFAAAVLVPVVTMILMYITRHRLECRWVAEKAETVSGSGVKITAEIGNYCFLPVNRAVLKFVVCDMAGREETCTIVTNLMPHTERRCTVEITPNYAGAVTVSLKHAVVYDLLGISKTVRKIGTYLRIASYPEKCDAVTVEVVGKTCAAEDSDCYSDIFPGNDRAQIFEVAPYRDGDHIKNIHWKLSMKTDEYVVKRYSLPVSNETNVFIDFDRREIRSRKMSAADIDRFFMYVFSVIDGLEKCGEHISLYMFDGTDEGVRQVDRTGVLMWDCDDGADIGAVCDTFSRMAGNGRNVLISSRMSVECAAAMGISQECYANISPDESTDNDVSDIIIEAVKVIGIDIKGKMPCDKGIMQPIDELYINRDDEDIGVYTVMLRMLLVLLGSIVPAAILLDIVVYDDSPVIPAVYGIVATAAMFGFTYIRKRRVKIIGMFFIGGFMLMVADIASVVNGAVQFIKAFGNVMIADEAYAISGSRLYGLTDENSGDITSFIAVITFVTAVLLFAFTWKSLSIGIHLAVSVPLVTVCYACGFVPAGAYQIMFVSYLFGAAVYRHTYSSIVINEKKVLKKAFYESTLNIGAISSYILIFVTVIIMMADVSKTYNRSETLVSMKMAINDYIENFGKTGGDDGGRIAAGGMNDGRLGMTDKVTFTGREMLKVDIEGNISFPIYLRGYVGSVYTGRSWETAGIDGTVRVEKDGSIYDVSMGEIYNMTNGLLADDRSGMINITDERVKSADVIVRIRDKYEASHYYVPYGASFNQPDAFDIDGVTNLSEHDDMRYDVLQITGVDGINGVTDTGKSLNARIERAYRDEAYNSYLYGDWLELGDEFLSILPESCTWKGRQINLSDGSAVNGYEVYIDYIRKYLSDNYEYTLAPGKLGEGEDFLQKFIRDKKGYCTHFATMATMMFRWYGIPARYVEGYYVSPSGGEINEYNSTGRAAVSVKDDKAHAWTEIYVDGYGWMPVEATPGYSSVRYDAGAENNTDETTDATHKNDETSASESKEPTTGGNEQRTTEKTVSGQDGHSVKPDWGNVFWWSMAIAALLCVSAVFGRKGSIEKKKTDIIEGDDSRRAAALLEQELEEAAALAGYHIPVNGTREETASALAASVREECIKKKCKNVLPDNFEQELVRMYAIFDEALYGTGEQDREKFRTASETAIFTVGYIYSLRSVCGKLRIKYIKCLYLK